MKKLSLCLFFLASSISLCATHVEQQIHQMHLHRDFSKFIEQHAFPEGTFNPNSAMHLLDNIRKELGALGVKIDLAESAGKALELLKEAGTCSVDDLQAAYHFYQQFIQQHPQFEVPRQIPIGLLCLLAGAMLDALPGTAYIGNTLISTGISKVTEGFSLWKTRVLDTP